MRPQGANDAMMLWNGVVARTAPGMAAADTLDAEPTALEYAVFHHRFHHILAAGGRIPARRRKMRGDAGAVEIYGQEKKMANHVSPRRRTIGHSW